MVRHEHFYFNVVHIATLFSFEIGWMEVNLSLAVSQLALISIFALLRIFA